MIAAIRFTIIWIVGLWAVAAAAQTATPSGFVVEGFYEFENTSTSEFVRSGTWTTFTETTGSYLTNAQNAGDRAISFRARGRWMIVWWRKAGVDMDICVNGSCTTYLAAAVPTSPSLIPIAVDLGFYGTHDIVIRKTAATTNSLFLDRLEIYQGESAASMPTPTPITLPPTPTEIVFPPTPTPWTPVPIATYTPTPWSRALAQLVSVDQVEVIGPGTYADNTSPQISYDGTWTNATETMAHWQTISTSTDGTAGFRFIGSGFSVYDFLGPAYGDLDVCVNGDCSTLSRAGTYGPAKIHVTGLDYGVHQVELVGAGDWAFDGVYIHAVIDFAAQSVFDPEATPDVDPDNVSQYILVGSTTARIDYSATAGDVASVLLLVGVFMSLVVLLAVTLWKR